MIEVETISLNSSGSTKAIYNWERQLTLKKSRFCKFPLLYLGTIYFCYQYEVLRDVDVSEGGYD